MKYRLAWFISIISEYPAKLVLIAFSLSMLVSAMPRNNLPNTPYVVPVCLLEHKKYSTNWLIEAERRIYASVN